MQSNVRVCLTASVLLSAMQHFGILFEASFDQSAWDACHAALVTPAVPLHAHILPLAEVKNNIWLQVPVRKNSRGVARAAPKARRLMDGASRIVFQCLRKPPCKSLMCYQTYVRYGNHRVWDSWV